MKDLIAFRKDDHTFISSRNRGKVKKSPRSILVLAMLFFSALLAACGSTEEKSNESQSKEGIEESQLTVSKEQNENDLSEQHREKQEKTAIAGEVLTIEPYKTGVIEEILQLEPGKYGEEKYDEHKVKEAITAFPKDLSPDDYFRRLLALTADDYRLLYKLFDEFDTSYSHPDAEPDAIKSTGTGVPVGKDVNVAILLDASGSMKAEIDGKSRMEHAKNAIQTFVSGLPSDVNVSLRVYGHKGAGNDQDKALSCKSTEVLYNLSPYQKEQFHTALHAFSPSGWTPLAASITAAYDELQTNSDEGTENIVYIVSDGVETCGGNPVEEAKKLNESNVKAIIHIIGFDVDVAGQNALQKVAEAGKGTYMTVTSQKGMEDFFNSEKRKLEKEWLNWQSENVNTNYSSERDKIEQVYAIKGDIYEKADNEMNRLRSLVDFMQAEKLVDERSKLTISSAIQNRNHSIRVYTRTKEQLLLKEIREKGAGIRENVRDIGAEERQKLKTPSNP